MTLTVKTSKRIFMLLGLIIICLTPIVIQPNIGSPAQADKPSSEIDLIVNSYAEAMQIGYEEAERRLTLTLQYEMSLVEQQIAQDEAYFASWMQHQPTFGLVVSFTTVDGQERIST